MGLRSPGRSGGRAAGEAPAACGLRWKIGCPGTGRPGAGRGPPIGTPGCTGALYTGRGPVCGTIIRGEGCGAAMGRGGGVELAELPVEPADGACAGGATTGRGGTETVLAATDTDGATTRRGVTGAVGGATTGGGGTGAVGFAGEGATGRLVNGGVTLSAGACAAGALTFSAVGCATAGALARGATGGTAAASLRCVIALSTSPGRAMCDKSILVLISSSPREIRDALLAAAEPSPCERRYTRTFSASCSSRELEWVFFSVTPTCGSASRIALLFTSSSRARSLIRTLLIRPFVSPCCI